jgi:hypothetical protein
VIFKNFYKIYRSGIGFETEDMNAVAAGMTFPEVIIPQN